MQNHLSHSFSRFATNAISGNSLQGRVKFDYESIAYGGNPAPAALKTGAAFFIMHSYFRKVKLINQYSYVKNQF